MSNESNNTDGGNKRYAVVVTIYPGKRRTFKLLVDGLVVPKMGVLSTEDLFMLKAAIDQAVVTEINSEL